MHKIPTVLYFCSRAEVSGPFRKVGVVGDDHSTSTCGYRLIPVETEDCGTTKAACMTTVESGSQGFCGIFNDLYPISGGDGDNFVNAYRVAKGVHGYYSRDTSVGGFIAKGSTPRSRVRFQIHFQRIGTHAKRLAVNIDESGFRSRMFDGSRCRRKSKILGDDFVPGFNPRSDQRYLECRGSVHQCDGESGSRYATDMFFEFSDVLPDIGYVGCIDAIGEIFFFITQEPGCM